MSASRFPHFEMSVTIRHGTPADAEALARIAAQTFTDTFGSDNRPEDLALHLARAYGPRQQGRELTDPTVHTLLAYVGQELAAYSQLRRGPAPDCVATVSPLEIWRFYVAKEWHGQGLAHTLMQHVEREAQQRDADTLWLGVWERNPRAIAFYRKAGFVQVGSHIFIVGSDAQTDHVLVRPVPRTSAC